MDMQKLQDFRNMGGVLYKDPNGEFEIHAGDIFEAKTILGHTNLIVAMRLIEGWIIYAHGDKCKKVLLQEFVRGIEGGDLELRWPDDVDKERLSMAVIMLDAIANRRTFEQSIDLMSDNADEYYARRAEGGSIIS